MSSRVLKYSAVVELVTGFALVIDPAMVASLLLGTELPGVAPLLARCFGIALIALGVACWPGTPLVGMLTYSAGVALYLAFLGFTGAASGIFLWPAVVLHLILTAGLTLSGRSARS